MNTMSGQTSTKYVVCHNGLDVYHYCIVDVGNELASGQPFMDVFDSQEQALVAFTGKIAINDGLTNDEFDQSMAD